MKSINNFIVEEKNLNSLRIGINDYPEQLYSSDPKEEGKCLILYCMTNTNDRNYRCELNVQKYELYNGGIDTKDMINSTSVSTGAFLQKNSKGYYTSKVPDNWVMVALFNDDAILFLNDILRNREKIIDLTEFDDILESDIFIKHMNNSGNIEFYTTKEIRNLIRKL